MRFMKRYLKVLLFLAVITSAVGSDQLLGQIQLAPPPTPVQPPTVSPEETDRERRIRNQRRERQLQRSSEEKEALTTRMRDYSDATKDRPMKFLWELTLNYPKISTRGDRENFSSEITPHTKAAYRVFGDNAPGKFSFWTGIRFAFFYGSGIYRSQPGRFGYSYFGPAFGFGQMFQEEVKNDSKRPAKISGFGQTFKKQTQSGWFFWFGVAAQSREGDADPSVKGNVDNEFDSTGIAFDSPGVWGEFSFLTIHYGAISMHYNLGAQFGEEKQFYWAGIGVGGWY